MPHGTDSSVTSLRLPIYAIKIVSALVAIVHNNSSASMPFTVVP